MEVHGNPTEAALVVLGRKAGLPTAAAHERWPRLDVVPFESEHKFMATLHPHDDGRRERILLKGAPERVLVACTALGADGVVRPVDEATGPPRDEIAAQGLRVLALAFRDREPEDGVLAFEDARHDFTMLALVGIIDRRARRRSRQCANATAPGSR